MYSSGFGSRFFSSSPCPSDHASSSSSSYHPDRSRPYFSSSQSFDATLHARKSEEYRHLFRLPSEEVLQHDFDCAIPDIVLFQGHMYLFDHYICFYSNIIGCERKIIIPFRDVTAVRRATTTAVFFTTSGFCSDAIEIVASGRKNVFTAFKSRDEAFKLINDGWSQHGESAKGSLDEQDSRSKTDSCSNGATPAEKDNFESAANVLDADERNLEVSTSEDTKLPANIADDNAQATVAEVTEVVEEDGNASSSGSVKWSQETLDAPQIPQCFTKVAETKFPINVKQFFNLFFSDDAVGFVESFHSKCGDKDFRCTSWSPLDKFGYVREKTFQHPIKIYFGAKCGGCKETQKFRVCKDRHLVIETSQEASDVPYADYFTVEGLWDVQKDAEKSVGCVLRVYVNVAFSKKTMSKGKIEQSTMEECREAYATWMQLAHELLKQKKVEKTEGNVVFDDQIDDGSKRHPREHSKRLQTNAEAGSISDAVTNYVANHEQSGNLLNGNLLDPSIIASSLREAMVKLCTYLKRFGNLQMFLVIGFSLILLLMQLSKVVLLSKPQVYVVPQASHLSSMEPCGGYRATGALHWLEKRMHLLKDEILVVESQLERMRNEYLLLKAQYNDLERLYPPQT